MTRFDEDADGQPTNWHFGGSRVCRRGLDELIGLCKGVMADGRLTQEEAQLLLSWLNTNWSVHDVWPANILVARFEKILEDGVIDADELRDLEDTIRKMLGDEPVYGYQGMMATRLPLCDPPPDIEFPGQEFCLTGKFVYGSRRACEDAIYQRGGSCASGVRWDTRYLVIGAIGSRDWLHSTHGMKIEKALEYRDARCTGLSIVAEEHWARYLDNVTPLPPRPLPQTAHFAAALLDMRIPGVGSDSATALAQHFGTVDALSFATVEQFLEVPGVGAAKAQGLASFFSDPFNSVKFRGMVALKEGR